MSTLIVGCGYLGRRVGRLLREHGERVIGTVRSSGKAATLSAWGVEPWIADVCDRASLARLPVPDHLLYCVGFDRSSGSTIHQVYVDGLRAVLEELGSRVERWVLISSTGVFGQSHGEEVTENSPAEPLTESGRACLDAEALLKTWTQREGLSSTILRPSGLYGPGRIVGRDTLLAGRAIPGTPDRWLNLVHIDDVATATVSTLLRESTPSPLYLIGGDQAIRRGDYYYALARVLSVAPPRFEESHPGDSSNKQISNQLIKKELGMTLRYPRIEEGLQSALTEESSQ